MLQPAVCRILIVFFLCFSVLRYVTVHKQRGYRDKSIQNSWTSSSAWDVGKGFEIAKSFPCALGCFKSGWGIAPGLWGLNQKTPFRQVGAAVVLLVTSWTFMCLSLCAKQRFVCMDKFIPSISLAKQLEHVWPLIFMPHWEAYLGTWICLFFSFFAVYILRQEINPLVSLPPIF